MFFVRSSRARGKLVLGAGSHTDRSTIAGSPLVPPSGRLWAVVLCTWSVRSSPCNKVKGGPVCSSLAQGRGRSTRGREPCGKQVSKLYKQIVLSASVIYWSVSTAIPNFCLPCSISLYPVLRDIFQFPSSTSHVKRVKKESFIRHTLLVHKGITASSRPRCSFCVMEKASKTHRIRSEVTRSCRRVGDQVSSILACWLQAHGGGRWRGAIPPTKNLANTFYQHSAGTVISYLPSRLNHS